MRAIGKAGRGLVTCFAAVVVLAGAACSGVEDEPTEGTPEPQAEPSPEPTADEGGRTPIQDRFDPEAVRLDLQSVAGGFENPLGIVNAGDGSDRLFVVEQTGAIRIVQDGEVLDEPFLDLGGAIVAGGEQGLLGVAFHPEYARNGRFFVNYTDVNGNTVVSEYRTSGDTNRADEGSGRALLQLDQPFANHNGGQIGFGADGYLYIATGDGGSGGDPMGNGQSTQSLLGKLLRIDVDGGDPYGIPEDNPFANGGGEPEIWAYGLRNPWRFSFDNERGQLWIADVGQDEFEEINRRPADEAGLNYGWNTLEGRDCFAVSDCDPGGTALPVSGYRQDLGCSVTGGFVYRGEDVPELRGGYVFADFCSGLIFAIDSRARGFTEPTVVLESGLSIASFGLDDDGELYLADHSGGELYRVVAP